MIVEPLWKSLLSDAERRMLTPGIPDPLPNRPDVLIVGGGLIGLSIAYFLAKRQVGQVLVVEQGDLASGASGANGGGIFSGQQRSDFPAEFRKLGLASRELYAELSAQDWADFDWLRNGSLAVAPEEFSCPMSDYAARENELGRRAEYLTGTELHDLEPALADGISEGIYYPDDAQLNPLRVAMSFTRVLGQMNVTIATGVRVEHFETNGSRIVRVRTRAGDIQPGAVVITTGWAAGQLDANLGTRIPVQPAKGQSIATAPLNWRMKTNVMTTQLLRQLPTGELLTGGSIEFVGESYDPTQTVMDDIAAVARRTIPALKNESFVRVWTGLRPHTPDEMPVIDRVPGMENAYLAAGHFTKGVLLAPITGQLVADWITSGQPSMDIGYLQLNRFGAA